MIKDALGDRMKHNYEEVSKTRLTRRMPVIIRLDGCHFHTFTHGFKKPFDEIMIETMQRTMKYLCKHIQGCVLGYTQSDEITLVLIDYQKLNSDAWFDYEVQKLCSVSAAMATYAFNNYFREVYEVTFRKTYYESPTKAELPYWKAAADGAIFDARCFNIPREEVVNCLLWRQKDAERNSVNSLAQSLFSHKELQGLNLKDTIAKIETEKGIIWGELSTTQKRGSCCIKDTKFILPDGQVVEECDPIIYDGHRGTFYYDNDGYYFFYREPNTENLDSLISVKSIKLDVKELSAWVIDNDIPRFNENRRYIEKLVFPAEEE